eukprot:gene11136-23275_t
MPKEGGDIPPLHHIEPHEAMMIQSMFNFYDYEATGRIRRHLACKLLQKLGLRVNPDSLPPNLSFKDLILFADSHCPDPTLDGALDICFRLSSTKAKETEIELMQADGVLKFLHELDRNPATESEANNFLIRMVPYDDCSTAPAVTRDAFKKHMVSIAIKNPASSLS